MSYITLNVNNIVLGRVMTHLGRRQFNLSKPTGYCMYNQAVH